MRIRELAALLVLTAPVVALAGTKYLRATLDEKEHLQLELEGGAVVPAPMDPQPLEHSGKQVGFGQPQISPDRETVGWAAYYSNCCTSYPIPLQIVIFRNGAIIQRIRGSGLPIWSWSFARGSKQIALAQRPTHGPAADHYELRDVATGELKQEYDQEEGDSTEQMPQWARDLHWNQ